MTRICILPDAACQRLTVRDAWLLDVVLISARVFPALMPLMSTRPYFNYPRSESAQLIVSVMHTKEAKERYWLDSEAFQMWVGKFRALARPPFKTRSVKLTAVYSRR